LSILRLRDLTSSCGKKGVAKVAKDFTATLEETIGLIFILKCD
ncbi:14844_t:CDS:2, partial [Gigaspora rosea]